MLATGDVSLWKYFVRLQIIISKQRKAGPSQHLRKQYLYPHPAQIHRARYCDTGIFLEVSNFHAGNCKVEILQQQFTRPA